MDSGKTTALQGVLLKNKFLAERKSLIICTEEGETEYDKTLLKKQNASVLYIDDEDDLNKDYLNLSLIRLEIRLCR